MIISKTINVEVSAGATIFVDTKTKQMSIKLVSFLEPTVKEEEEEEGKKEPCSSE